MEKSMRIGLVSGVAGFAGMQAISVSRFGDMVWTFFSDIGEKLL